MGMKKKENKTKFEKKYNCVLIFETYEYNVDLCGTGAHTKFILRSSADVILQQQKNIYAIKIAPHRDTFKTDLF